ncbi:hypothetical protein BBJ29_005080 [Phytophthora kernoviae]|uniref:Cation-transporting P-type ATPase C-terminal domain-containing protein n=1 Tax=Phytophthora kernoviae TaxID=325452 RepID=A0A3R7N0C6_9STRA|nr:hypothetical protein BBJ29_005080 [Phytophthora kernoviae]
MVSAGEGIFLVAAAMGNVLLNMTQKRRHHAEMAERVRVAVQQMLRESGKKGEDEEEEGPPIWLGSGLQPTALLPSNSYAACYRDNQWQRLPMNLLVDGDVVGLMSGDIAPGEVRPVGTTDGDQEQQQIYSRGCKLPTWTQRQTSDTSRCTATFDPPLLLELCGEMRIFEMLETPVTPSVEEIFLLNDKQNNNSTVLDLHAERDCDTGLKFEDPKWKQHLPSLKPIGLAIMVNDDENPEQLYDENMREKQRAILDMYNQWRVEDLDCFAFSYARLPHGVEAIKRHLAEVDNVPLLVSLYTDSTPETISEMISIFQENHEVVMGVGSSLKESNAPLFSKADLAVALQGGVQAFFDQQIPHGKELPVFSDEDIQFSHILNTLACSFRLKSTRDGADSQGKHNPEPAEAEDNATTGGTASVAHLIELIRLGRRMLTNFCQMNTFIFVSQLFLATLILASYAVPFPHVPQLSCASIFWLLWVLVPALSLSMLASASEKDIMKKTPRKNEEFETDDDLPRLVSYFLVRHVPSALMSIIVFECLLGFSLQAANSVDPYAFGSDRFREFRWMDFILDNSLVTMRPRPTVVQTAVHRAEAGMFLMIGICIVTSSCGYVYRCESIFKLSPFRNVIWVVVAFVLLCLQLLLSMVRAGFVGADGVTLWNFVSASVPWTFWAVVFGVWPLLIVAIDEAVKTHDKRHLVRYNKFLRMQFDTRLGMWSPK